MIRKLLCKLGWHDWVCYDEAYEIFMAYPGATNYRLCLKCYKSQVLRFHCGKKDREWVTLGFVTSKINSNNKNREKLYE